MAKIGAWLVVSGSLLTGLVFGVAAGLSFLAGGTLAVGNVIWLRHTVSRLVFRDSKASKRRVLAGFFLRLLLLPLTLYVMIRFLFLNVPAAVGGFAIFYCSVFVEGILEAIGSSSK